MIDLIKINDKLKEQALRVNDINNPELNNLKSYLKKDFMVKEACIFYDEQVDKPLNLPWFIDWGVKALFIPFAADCAVWELKELGLIPKD